MFRGLFVCALILCLAPPAWAGVEEGWRAYLRGDHSAAVAELRPLAEAGDAQAQYYMGTLSEHGAGVPTDYRAAAAWYEKAAGQGLAAAQFNLGLLYYHGAGAGTVAQDIDRAAKLLLPAAKAGNAMAQHLVGRMYNEGRGLARDPAEALKWTRRAADRGVPGAQFDLGLSVAGRRHTVSERIAAYAWMLLAARAGHPGARENLESLGRDLTHPDILRATAYADAWRPAE
jgi:TPR repeat protein